MDEEEFLMLMQRYVANISISGSTLRNQGAAGVAEAARQFLAELPLNTFLDIQSVDYPGILNQWTEKLRTQLPLGAQNWGTARKALNVFLVQVFLNRYLEEHYGLNEFGEVLETPLDSYAAKGLKRLSSMTKLPRWDAIKRLTTKSSKDYQECASQVAQQRGLNRACLDIILWRPKKESQSGEDRKS